MTPGLSFGHYRITAKLGAGGMGEVWRAVDTRLGREVAIKVLAEAFAEDASRMTRLHREAQTLASLNHPNIAAIYSVEDRALVMELVEGPTLAERIARGPLPLDEALAIAKQLADALEAAHEHGIVHRDLKPSNIKVRPDGACKVLDFGLAKAARCSVESGGSTQSVTLTEAGMIVGTPSYMAPEQARGKSVDKRCDIWAFGVILFEMITGRRLFTGDNTAEILAAVLTHDPDWTALPPLVRPLIRAALQRDPRDRLRDIADIRFFLKENTLDGSPVRSRLPRWMPALGLALAALAVLAAMIFWPRHGAEPRPLIRFATYLGADAIENSGQGMDLALSENGARIANLVRDSGVQRIATRRLDQATASVTPGTENATGLFLSPDGNWVGFFANGKLKKTPVQGGPVIDLCDATDARGAWWGSDGYIVASLTMGGGLVRLPDSGGPPQPITNPALTDEATHRWPQVLPSGDVLFTGHKMTMNYDDATLEVLLRTTGKWKPVLKGGYCGRYVRTGHLLYVRRSTLYAVPFDPKRLEVRGTPVPLLADIASNNGNAAGRYAAENDILVYFSNRADAASQPVVWFDDMGGVQKIPLEPGKYAYPRVSPDGAKLAISVITNASDKDMLVYDLHRDSSTRLTFEGDNRVPVWTPDSKHIVYEAISHDSVSLRWARADGAGQVRTLYETRHEVQPNSFSPDGKVLVFSEVGTNTAYHLWTMRLDLSDPDNPKPGPRERLLAGEGMEDWQGAVSPDGRWIAYAVGAAGVAAVFVRPFPPMADREPAKWEIARGDVNFPMWSRTRPELYFIQGHQIMVVEYSSGKDSFTAGKPRLWLKGPLQVSAIGDSRSIDISPDGKRFVVRLPSEKEGAAQSAPLVVVLNFFDELKRKVPVN